MRRLRTPRGTHRPLLPFGPGGVKQVSAVPRRLRYYSIAVLLCQVRRQSQTCPKSHIFINKDREYRWGSRDCGLVERSVFLPSRRCRPRVKQLLNALHMFPVGLGLALHIVQVLHVHPRRYSIVYPQSGVVIHRRMPVIHIFMLMRMGRRLVSGYCLPFLPSSSSKSRELMNSRKGDSPSSSATSGSLSSAACSSSTALSSSSAVVPARSKTCGST
jgi:hypothetical protein